MSLFTYREYLSAVDLSPFVECFWSIETSSATNTAVPPDGCVDIVFSPNFGLRIVGAMTTEQIFSLSAGTQTIGVRFRPGMARAVFGVPLGQLTDSFMLLEDLWPQRGKELKERLLESRSVIRRIEVLQNAIKPSHQAATPIQRILKAVSLAHGNVNLNYLASQANLSSRQFRRRCREEAGLTPKHLCRILRFQRARQLAVTSPKPNWSRIAAETGYFDQAHLIRDFREFTGRTPMSVLSNTQLLRSRKLHKANP